MKQRSGPALSRLALAALVGATLAGTTIAQRLPKTDGASSAAAVSPADFEALKGAWVRPDGGYVILIRNVAADGALEAMYFNPNPLPFAKAKASREASAIRVAFELQAGGYSGSTYELTYNPATDRLSGTYYQAVARQSFAVSFARK